MDEVKSAGISAPILYAVQQISPEMKVKPSIYDEGSRGYGIATGMPFPIFFPYGFYGR